MEGEVLLEIPDVLPNCCHLHLLLVFSISTLDFSKILKIDFETDSRPLILLNLDSEYVNVS